MKWDAEKRGILTRAWLAGAKTAEIGVMMGISKSAVIGEAHRLELPARPSPIWRKDGTAPRPRAQTASHRRPVPRPKAMLPPLAPALLVAPTPAPRPVIVAPQDRPRAVQTPPLFTYAAGGWGCQWITRRWRPGDLVGSNICGQPRRARGCSWCDKHFELVYDSRASS